MCAGEEVFLLWQNWGFSAVNALSEVRHSIATSLYATEYRFLTSHRSRMDCGQREEGDTTFFTDCLRRKLRAGLERHACLPPPIKSHVDTGVRVRKKGRAAASRSVY